MSSPTNEHGCLARRALLKAVGGSVAGYLLLRPLVAAAEGASAPRFVIIHRPCGTRPERWTASGSETSFQLGELMKPLEPFRAKMIAWKGVTCPRDPTWSGDKHGTAIITLLSGRRHVAAPGSVIDNPESPNIMAAGPTIDQWLLSKVPALQGRPLASLQLAADPECAKPYHTQHRVLSYAAATTPLWPEVQPNRAYARVFATLVPGADDQSLVQARMRKRSVLDFLLGDLDRVRKQTPATQKAKLDSHLEAIREMERTLDGVGEGRSCKEKPAIETPSFPGGDSKNLEAHHAPVIKAHLAIIRAALACDVTRVVAFSYSHGNSNFRFSSRLPSVGNGGHHDQSHNAGAANTHALIDLWYSERTAEFLASLNGMGDGSGSLLDQCLVAYFNEVSTGWNHGTKDIPLTFFGSAGGRIRPGRLLDAGGRYSNDVWSAVSERFGAGDQFGDPAWGTKAFAGLV